MASNLQASTLALVSTTEKTALTIPGTDKDAPALIVSQAAVDAASERAAKGAATRYAARYLVAAMLPAIITERKSNIATGKAQAMCLADSAGLVKAALATEDSSDRRKARATLKRGAGCIAPKSAVALALAAMTDEEVGS